MGSALSPCYTVSTSKQLHLLSLPIVMNVCCRVFLLPKATPSHQSDWGCSGWDEPQPHVIYSARSALIAGSGNMLVNMKIYSQYTFIY